MISALLVLVTSVIVGTVAHELSHAVALTAFRVPHSIRWFPDRAGSSELGIGVRGRWAAVNYHSIPPDLARWKLRVAAIMPFSLIIPVALFLAIYPGTIGPSNLTISLAVFGWLACAIPSPADFAIFWHPDESIAKAGEALRKPGS